MKKQFCVKTLILCLCVFFVCTAFADQKDRQADIYRLRSKPQVLSEDDVRDMIRKHNFYSRVSFIMGKKWQNKSGSFRNDFTDNINGTVTDSVTGLMWQKSGSDNGGCHMIKLKLILTVLTAGNSQDTATGDFLLLRNLHRCLKTKRSMAAILTLYLTESNGGAGLLTKEHPGEVPGSSIL